MNLRMTINILSSLILEQGMTYEDSDSCFPTKSGRWDSKSYRLCWIFQHFANMNTFFRRFLLEKYELKRTVNRPPSLIHKALTISADL